MKNRECFESYRDYVEYLERRVRFLEQRLREYRDNRKEFSERKRPVTEMAQPLHRKVCLLIPLPDNPDCDPLEITFVSRTLSTKGKRHHYIDMSDYEPNNNDQIAQLIELPDYANSETSALSKTKEQNDLATFSDQIVTKYGVAYIKNAIISCYNNYVVDHNSRFEQPLPKDICWVKWDILMNQVVPNP